MTRRRTSAATACLVLIVGLLVAGQPSPALAAPLNDCVDGDNGRPRLSTFDMSPTSVDVTRAPRTVAIRVEAFDVGGPGPASKVKSVRVAFTRPVHPDGSRTVALRRSGGLWVGTARVSRWSKAGTLPVRSLLIEDRAGNQRSVSGAALRAGGFVQALSVTSTSDTTKPRLLRVHVTPASVDTRTSTRRVTFTARAGDSQSGVRLLAVAGAMRGRPVSGGRYEDVVWLTRVEGTAHQYRGSMRVRRWVGNGTWRMFGAYVEDRLGNSKVYPARVLDSMGVHRSISVTSTTERGRPHSSSTIKPNPLDIRTTSQTVTARVFAADQSAGVRRVRIVLQPIPGDHTLLAIPLRRVSGTARAGTWVGTATLPRCAPTTGRLRVVTTVTDHARHQNTTTATLRVKAADHLTPEADLPSPDESFTVKPAGQISVPFSEPVNGITRESATLRRDRANGSRGPIIAGQWTCLTGQGTTTNCETGAVRTARFKPADNFLTGHTYQVELNPEFLLDVTDLAGNPFRRDRGTWYVTN